jgi:hypothetical protein
MTEAQKATSETPAAIKPTPGETPAPDTTTEEPFDAERAKALIAKLRAESKDAAKNAKRLSELEAAEAKRAEADLTAAQLAEKRLTDLQAKLTAAETAAAEREQAAQRERAEHAVALKAQAVGLPVKAALKLLDWDELKYDDHGQPTNVDKLVEALLKDYPLLATPVSGATFGTPAARPRLGQPPPPNTPRKIIPL